MITLAELAIQLGLPVQPEWSTLAITAVACRPQDATPGCLYCVVDEYLDYGQWIQGQQWLENLPAGLAAAILTATPLPSRSEPVLLVEDARKAMALAARTIHGQPDTSLQVIGITGTKGKTTTSQLISQWLTLVQRPCAAMGTLGLLLPDGQHLDTVYTTPLSADLFRWLNHIQKEGCQGVAMEISSHAIKLDRSYGLHLSVAVFTNLTRDHLDFHKTWQDYRDTKFSLFANLPAPIPAVVNVDDPVGNQIHALAPHRFLGYGCQPEAALRASAIQQRDHGMTFQLHWQGRQEEMHVPLLGRFNVDNVLAALGVCLTLGVSLDELLATAGSLRGVPGRMELVPLPEGRIGVVDFAHTPDSLEKILLALRDIAPHRRIWTVFGCGGDRDRGKRPLMGEVACRLSHKTIVTSDNPRSEDPEAILSDIMTGITTTNVYTEVDRRQAIRWAYQQSQPGDILLLAGKGHENKQIFRDHTLPFSDRQELESLR